MRISPKLNREQIRQKLEGMTFYLPVFVDHRGIPVSFSIRSSKKEAVEIVREYKTSTDIYAGVLRVKGGTVVREEI